MLLRRDGTSSTRTAPTRTAAGPNQYNSETDKWDHTFNDEGGIWHKGWDAFWESRVHPVKKKAREADSWFARQKARWLYGAP